MLARPEGDVHLNILVELAEDRNHPVKREAAKLRVADTGKFGVGNARQLFGVAGRKLAIIEDADNLRRDNGARLLQPGVRAPEVGGKRCRCRVPVPYRRFSFQGLLQSLEPFADKIDLHLRCFDP